MEERATGTFSKGGPVSTAISSAEYECVRGDGSGSVEVVAETEPSRAGADAVKSGLASETFGAGRSCRDASSHIPPR